MTTHTRTLLGRRREPDVPTERVAVVVVTYNSADLLPDLVASFPAGLSGVAHQFVFVDNASRDGSLETAGRLVPDATLVQTGGNTGYAAGINAGVAAADQDCTAFLVLNPDVRLGPGCVRELIRGLRVDGTGIAVPHLVDREGELIPSMRREPSVIRATLDFLVGAERLGGLWDAGEIVFDERKYEAECLTDWAEGSTQLISRECWDACGTWDETFFLFSEETEYGLRTRDAGFSTRYVPTAHAQHLEGGSVDDPMKWALVVKNKVRLFHRRHALPTSLLFYGCIVARETSRAVLGHRRSKQSLRVLLSRKGMRAEAGPQSLVPR